MSLEELRKRKERALLANPNPARPLISTAIQGPQNHIGVTITGPITIDLTDILEQASRMDVRLLYRLRDEIEKILERIPR